MGRVLPALADSGPVLVLAAIAAAGSFTHIRETAHEHGQHGWMAWAIAVCIDLTCVMAARERQRDRRTHRPTRALSWPTAVLIGGILLSLAANLAQAEPTAWGWITAATPALAFLVAVSMLERRATPRPASAPSTTPLTVPPSFGRPDSPSAPSPSSAPAEVADANRPELTAPSEQPATRPDTPPGPAAPLVEFARRVAAEHQDKHGRPITRDALRARLGVSNQLASDLLRQIRTPTT